RYLRRFLNRTTRTSFSLDRIERTAGPRVGTHSPTRPLRAAATRERRRDRGDTEKSLLAARSLFCAARGKSKNAGVELREHQEDLHDLVTRSSRDSGARGRFGSARACDRRTRVA